MAEAVVYPSDTENEREKIERKRKGVSLKENAIEKKLGAVKKSRQRSAEQKLQKEE